MFEYFKTHINFNNGRRKFEIIPFCCGIFSSLACTYHFWNEFKFSPGKIEKTHNLHFLGYLKIHIKFNINRRDLPIIPFLAQFFVL